MTIKLYKYPKGSKVYAKFSVSHNGMRKVFTKGEYPTTDTDMKFYKMAMNSVSDYTNVDLAKEGILTYLTDVERDVLTTSDILSRFMAHSKEKGLSEGTLERYQFSINKFKKWRKNVNLDGFTNKHMNDFAKWMLKWGNSKQTANLHCRLIAQVVKFAYTYQYIKTAPPKYEQPYRLNTDNVHIVVSDEIPELLEDFVSETTNMYKRKIALMFLLSCYTSLRHSDIITLKLSEIKKGTKHKYDYIHRVNIKGKKRITLPLNKKARKVIKKAVAYENNDGELFGNELRIDTNRALRSILTEIFEEKDIYISATRVRHGEETVGSIDELISFHDARRYFITKAVNKPGANLKAISQLVGHSSVLITEKYVQERQDIKHDIMKNIFD